MLRKLIAVNGSYFCLFLCGWLVFSLPMIAFAQSDTTYKLNQVEVFDQKKIKSTRTYQEVNQTDFIHVNANNVADAIKNFSGVNIKDYGGVGGLKTVSVRSLGAGQTGVFYDGIQITDAQNGQVDLGRISLTNIQQIELFNTQPDEILLPARAFSTASFLNIKTIKPQLEQRNQIIAQIKGGSFGLIEPYIQYQHRLTNKLYFTLNGLYSYANGEYSYKIEGDGSTSNYIRKNGDLTTYQNDVVLNYQSEKEENFSLSFNYFNSERGLPGAIIFYNDFSSQRLHDKDFFAQAKYQTKLNAKWQLLLNAKLSNTNAYYVDPNYLNAQGKLEQDYHQQEYYFSSAASYQLLKNLKLAYAADGAINQLQTNLYQFYYPTRFSLLQNLAADFQLGKLKVNANVLHTKISEQVKSGIAAHDKSILTPSFSLGYQPFEETDFHLRAFYKNIFRMPTFNDLYYSRIGNVKLKPEYTSQYNIGFTYGFKYATASYLQLITDVYYNNIKDKIIAVPNKDIFSWSMMNLGLVDIKGIDAGIKNKIKLNQQFDFHLATNFTFQEAIDVTDNTSSYYLNQIPYTPKYTIAANAGISNQKIAFYYNLIYSSDRYYMVENLPKYLVKGFSVSDVSINCNYKLFGLKFNSAVELNNIFNVNYAVIRSFPMPGRSYRLTLQIKI